jgi:RNA polymerase sigma factor (sigma-70 family)
MMRRMDRHLVRAFPPTRHSAVAAVRDGDAKERARGLETLAAVYWRPVYSYLRLRWHRPHEEAADLAQELFAEVVEKELIARFDPSRARLRTFLRVCIDGLVANRDRAAARQKRDDGNRPFEGANAESPEALFEKEWARAVFAIALQRLRDECERAGKARHYALLERYDLAGDRATYADLAGEFGIPVTDVTNHLSRTRRDLRRIVLDILRELTSSEEELREEARALFAGNGAA